MKLYKVSRTDNIGYDEYCSFVCCANSADEARTFHPSPDYYVYQEDGWHNNYGGKEKTKYHGWSDDLKSLEVIEIIPSTVGVILASFNAG